jgi:ABC-type cobalamin/Fe3+-siderophores transport system ATPase subunit
MHPGAGKSTLMDILAGRKSVGELKGLVLVNKQRQHKETFRKRTAYVPQVRVEECSLLGVVGLRGQHGVLGCLGVSWESRVQGWRFPWSSAWVCGS